MNENNLNLNTDLETEDFDTEDIDLEDLDTEDADTENLDTAGDESETTDDPFLDAFVANIKSLPTDIMGRNGGKGVPSISIVNSQKGNGRRISITDSMYDKLKAKDSLMFACLGSKLAIATELPGETKKYNFSPDPNRHIIYSSPLVHGITEAFNLCYTDGTTSRAFRSIEFRTIKNKDGKAIPVALVSMTE